MRHLLAAEQQIKVLQVAHLLVTRIVLLQVVAVQAQ